MEIFVGCTVNWRLDKQTNSQTDQEEGVPVGRFWCAMAVVV
jgi:hypothetical protein